MIPRPKAAPATTAQDFQAPGVMLRAAGMRFLLLLLMLTLASCAAKNTPNTPQNAGATTLEQADELYASGQYARAAAGYGAAAEAPDAAPDTLRKYGECLLATGQGAKAADILERAARLQPEDRNTQYNRGMAYYQMQNWDNAVYAFRRAAELSQGKDKAQALNNAGLCFQRKGEAELAVQDFNDALRADPDNLDVRYNRGSIYLDLRLYQAALIDFDRLLQARPDDTASLNNRGITRMMLEDYDGAVQDFTSALTVAPGNAESFYNRALAYHRSGRFQQAISDDTRAIGNRPDYPEAYNNRGAAYLALERNEEGCRDLQHACDLGACDLLKRMQDGDICP